MSKYTLQTGISLNNRTLFLNIPNGTSINSLKYIAKTDNPNNYIAEDNEIGYFHYLDEEENEVISIFYRKNGINHESIKLPDNFGVITEIDDTAVLYQYIKRTSHEKVFVISEDMGQKESMGKEDIEIEVEENVKQYLVPTGSIIGYDGTDIPEGFEEYSTGSNVYELGICHNNIVNLNQNVNNFKFLILTFADGMGEIGETYQSYLVSANIMAYSADGSFNGWSVANKINVNIGGKIFKAIIRDRITLEVTENETGLDLYTVLGVMDTDEKFIDEVASLSNRLNNNYYTKEQINELLGDLSDDLDDINGEVV